jgi:spore cortex biosynthesis protein YabQ
MEVTMNKAIAIEMQFFLVSILWGAIILFVYDLLRIFRRLVKHNEFFIAIEDLIFWVLASLFIFIMMYQQNNGIIRGFSIMGMGIGMVLYHFALSELFVSLVTKLIHILLKPLKILYQKLRKLLSFLLGKGKKVIKFLLLRLKKTIASVKIALDKKKQKRLAKKTKRQEVRLARKKAKEKERDIGKKKKEDQKKKAKSKQGKRKSRHRNTNTKSGNHIVQMERMERNRIK